MKNISPCWFLVSDVQVSLKFMMMMMMMMMMDYFLGMVDRPQVDSNMYT